jgi:Transcription factor WhiB
VGLPPSMPGAACMGRVDLPWVSESGSPGSTPTQVAVMRAICAGCPWLEDCRDFATRGRETGFWGGTTAAERAAGFI